MKKKNLAKSLCCVLSLSMVMTSAAPVSALAEGAVPETEGVGVEANVVSKDTGDASEKGEVTTEEETDAADVSEAAAADTDEAGAVTAKVQENPVNTAEGDTYVDGINDGWTQEAATVKGGEICALEDGWLHLKSGASNGNNPSETTPPAVFKPDKTFDLSQAGYFEMDMRTEQAGNQNRVGIYLGYASQFKAMFIGYDASGWLWQKYGMPDNPYKTIAGTPVPAAGSTVHIKVEWTADKKASLYVDGAAVFKEEDFSGIDGLENAIAIKAGTFGTALTDVYLQNIHYPGQEVAKTYSMSGRIVENVNGANVPVKDAAVKLGSQTVTTGADGSYSFAGIAAGTYKITAAKDGYDVSEKEVKLEDQDLAVEDIVLKKTAEIAVRTISSASMDVDVAESFPSVVKYTMKGKEAGKVFYGQTKAINTIKINNTEVKLAAGDVKATFAEDNVEYTMTVKGANIDAVLTAVLAVKDNTLSFDITKVENKLDNNTYPVQTIEIPNHSLISVRSSQEGANLKGSKVSSNVTISGDKSVDVTDDMTFSKEDFMYGFVSNDELSAGIFSNSENEGTNVAAYVGSGGSSNTRVWAETEELAGSKSLGLGSTQWYYDRKVTTTVDGMPKTYVVEHDPEVMPSAKIVITGDENADSQIDWQDGAIAFRDIMHDPYKSEEVPDLVAQRIAMNFGSEAANPFTTTLEGVKRVYLNTDGLGQSIILKGYASEGHDSGHPDYDNIGMRIGGAEDMNELMVKGKDMGARFGIHINASEMYPESKAFNDDLSRHSFGWNWLDQGIGINGMYDLASNSRNERLDKLKTKVGDNLDFIYLDVWGNNVSGREDSWESRKIAKQMNDHGWRFTTEWGPTQEYDSTLQHWASDLHYGGYAAKGQNSEVMRFLRNHQKDSWVGDYPEYNGAAQSPLLGGLNMTDFEGWSGRTDYESYIETTFTHNVMTKFFQHFKVMKWENGEPVAMTTYYVNGNTPTQTDYSWTPEMRITLQDDAKKNTVVVSRDSNDYANNLQKYRSRTVTLNGKIIATGAPTGGDGSNPGDEAYLLPWYWDTNGEALSAADEKLYHYNIKGGTTTWDLPNGWESLANVVVYKLTDQGKTEKNVVPVVNGKVTLEDMKAVTPYVVYKGEKGQLSVDWQSSKYLYDAGFNSGSLDSWTKTGSGTAAIARNASYNPMLKLTGEVSVTSKSITNLVPGKKYAFYAGVDNRGDAKASMILKADGKEIASNYTKSSFVRNIVSSNQHHSGSGSTQDGVSYFQNMYVFFTAPASGQVTITFKHDKGDGAAYFDDMRVVETGMDTVKEVDKNGLVTEFAQDFENNAQGIYPFVISGPGTGVTDNRIHLSELHAPYTQSGYFPMPKDGNSYMAKSEKHLSDVLDGSWSVKINGLVGGNSLIYQTIPQNFRFEPDVTYKVTFKYQLGSEGSFKVAVGEGGQSSNLDLYTLPEAIGETKECTFYITGAESGQSWFGIYSTNLPTDYKELSDANLQSSGLSDGQRGNLRDFSGYKDFILDDLKIQISGVQKGDLAKAIRSANEKLEQDYEAEGWTVFAAALEKAAEVNDNGEATAQEVADAAKSLNDAMKGLAAIVGSIKGTVKDADGKPIAGAQVTLTNSLDGNVLTATTDGNGTYKFDNVFVREYSAKIVKEGYAVEYGTVTTKKGETATSDISVEVKDAAEYASSFDDGSIDSIKTFDDNEGSVTASATEYDGSGALKAVYSSGRPSIVDTSIPKFKNGTFEADVTPVNEVKRVGFVVRANGGSERIYIGYGDAAGKWFWEYWSGGNNAYQQVMSDGPVLEAGKTAHIKVELKDSAISLWVNGTEVMKDLAVNGLPQEPGYVGFNKRDGGSVIYDNIEVNVADEIEGTNGANGTVADQTGAPVYKAILTLKDAEGKAVKTTTANLKGVYSFKHVPYGKYTLEVSKDGYEAAGTTVEIAAGDAAVVGKLVIKAVSKAALNAKLAEAKAIIKGSYTDASYKALTDAIAAAEKVAANPKALQKDVDAQVTALTKAIKGLKKNPVVVTVTKTALNAKLAQAKAIQKGYYTDASYKALTDAIAAAQSVVNNPNATQAQVDAQVGALTKAISGLMKDANREAADKVKASTVRVKAVNSRAKYIKLSWNRVTSADGYVIRYKVGTGKWTSKTITKNSTTSYVFKKAVLGKKCYFAVRAYKKADGKTAYSKYKRVSIKAIPEKPTIKVTAAKRKATVRWKKISGVTGYYVYRKTGSSWRKVASLSSKKTKFVDRKVSSGKKYSYKVRAYRKYKKKITNGVYSKTIRVKVK